MKKLLIFLFIIYQVASKNIRVKRDSTSRRVVCYYRPGVNYKPSQIPPFACTHVLFAFAVPDLEKGIGPFNPVEDLKDYVEFTNLKRRNPELKTVLAVGGRDEGSSRFSEMVSTPARRQLFLQGTIDLLRRFDFDGIDLAWQFPTLREGSRPEDRENYIALARELREGFELEGRQTGRPRLTVTLAVPAITEFIDVGYNITAVNPFVDFMCLLTYDLHEPQDALINHHAPLYPLPEELDDELNSKLNIDWAIKHYINLGADPDKLVFGIPTYGRTYTLANPSDNEINSISEGPGVPGEVTREPGRLAYHEICTKLKEGGWTIVKRNSTALGPYAYKSNQWISFDDAEMIRRKAFYARRNNLGGIMFWAMPEDDYEGKCDKVISPLINAGLEAMQEPLSKLETEFGAEIPDTPIVPSTESNFISDQQPFRPPQPTFRPPQQTFRPPQPRPDRPAVLPPRPSTNIELANEEQKITQSIATSNGNAPQFTPSKNYPDNPSGFQWLFVRESPNSSINQNVSAWFSYNWHVHSHKHK